MNYVLDTNILLHFLKRKASKIVYLLKEEMDIFGKGHCAMVSIVTIGEVKALSKREDWGPQKLKRLDELLDLLETIWIEEDIVEHYADIDAYMQGVLGASDVKEQAYKMGKNDIWIAASTRKKKAMLITTDKDFCYLANSMVDLMLLSIKGKYLDPDDVIKHNLLI